MPELNLLQIYYYSNAFHFISRSPATKNCLLSQNNFAVQSQKAASANFTSKQILPFGFSRQNFNPCTKNNIDLSHDDTICLRAHLKVYYLYSTFEHPVHVLVIFSSTCSCTRVLLSTTRPKPA